MNNTLDYIAGQLALSAIRVRPALQKLQRIICLKYLKWGTTELSNKGNVFVTIGGSGSPLILAAHIDTLGAMVRSIKENGRLRPTTLGGHQWRTADGENCTVHTRDGRVYTGVVLNTRSPPHTLQISRLNRQKKIWRFCSMKMSHPKRKPRHSASRPAISSPWIKTVITSGYIKSRFLDDKLSAAILLGLARTVKEEGLVLNHKVFSLFLLFMKKWDMAEASFSRHRRNDLS